jgi:hypothetical protein
MRQSKFDKVNATLDRAAFALEQLQKSGQSTSQAVLGKNAGRDCGFGLRGGRTFATATKNQGCSTCRQSGASPSAGLRYRMKGAEQVQVGLSGGSAAAGESHRETLRFSADDLPRFSTTSYSTAWPSFNEVSPARSTAEMCTNTSLPPPTG